MLADLSLYPPARTSPRPSPPCDRAWRSTSPRWRRPPRSGTPRSTSRRPRCSAFPIRRATRSSCCWRTSSALLPLAASYAARINLFAAVTSAAAAGLWFLVAERWLRAVVPVTLGPLGAAFAGVLVGATIVDGVEPVHGEREGVHRLAALDRAGDVAGGALGRRRARGPPRPLAGAHRLHAGAQLHQPHDGRASAGRRARGRSTCLLDRLARCMHSRRRGLLRLGDPSSWPRAACGDLAQLHLPADPRGPVPADQRGRADGFFTRR